MVRVEEKERDDSEYRWHLFVKIFIKTFFLFFLKKEKKRRQWCGWVWGGWGRGDRSAERHFTVSDRQAD